MIRPGQEIIAAIVGPSLCGKTSLAIGKSRAMRARHGLRSLAYDPWCAKHNWGPWSWVTNDLAKFERAVANTKGCAVFWDESSDSLERNSVDHKKMFTRIRHQHPAFFLIAHDFAVMSPLMRGNLTEAYIFRQSEERANDWRRLFADRDLLQTAELEQREFIIKRPFQPIVRMKPTLASLGNL